MTNQGKKYFKVFVITDGGVDYNLFIQADNKQEAENKVHKALITKMVIKELSLNVVARIMDEEELKELNELGYYIYDSGT